MTQTDWARKLPPLPAGFGPPAGITCKKLDMFLEIYEGIREGYTTHEVALVHGLTPKYVWNVVSRLRRWTHHPQWYSKVYGKSRAYYRAKPVTAKNKPKRKPIK